MDLIAGVTILAALAGLLFWLGTRLGRALPVRRVKALGVAVCAALLAYITLLYDNVLLARLLPVSNLIAVGNWIPLLVSLLAGLAWSLLPRQAPGCAHTEPHTIRATVQARRALVVLALQAVGWIAVARPLWGTPPRCANRWEGDVCIQTSEKSCTAACAATLLKAHGIDATEPEMAGLCLTRRGTLWQGLYRGLKLKTAGTPWDVEVIHGPFEILRALRPGVAIVAAGIPRNSDAAHIYTERYGWSPGEWHSVLFYGFRGNGRVAMGDPSPGIGREEWTDEDLRVLWGGRGMRVVPRKPWRGLGQLTESRESR